MGFVWVFLRSTPAAVRFVDGASSIVGVVLLISHHFVLGGALLVSAIFVGVVTAFYNTHTAQENRERQWQENLARQRLEIHPRAYAYEEPKPTARKAWVQVGLSVVAITALTVGAVAAYRRFEPPPFSIAASATIWTSGTAASGYFPFFGYLPTRKQLPIVNAAAYLRLINGPEQQTIIDYSADGLVSNEWEPLLVMPAENSTFRYYFADARKPKAGWELPATYDLVATTANAPVASGGVASGWVFFAFRGNLIAPMTKLRITVTNSVGQSVTREFESNNLSQLDLEHGPELPDESAPSTAFNSDTFIWYAKMVGL